MHTLVLIIVCMSGSMIDCMHTNTDTDTNDAVFIHSSPLRAARTQTKGTDRMTSECWVTGYGLCWVYGVSALRACGRGITSSDMGWVVVIGG